MAEDLTEKTLEELTEELMRRTEEENLKLTLDMKTAVFWSPVPWPEVPFEDSENG